MTPCPMCGHDVTGTENERGVLINAIASSGARLTALRDALRRVSVASSCKELSDQFAAEANVMLALEEKLEGLR